MTAVTVVAIVWAALFNVRISPETIPILINGITSSTSVIIGFSGTIIGIMLREIDKSDRKTRVFYMLIIALLALPLTMLWSTYVFLAMNWLETAIRYSLSGLILALYIFIAIIIYSVNSLKAEIDKVLAKEQKTKKAKPESESVEETEQEKLKREFRNRVL